jgi:hypothetical protein
MRGISEKLLVKSAIPPDNYNAAAAAGLTIDTRDFDEVVFVLHSGTNGSGGTVDIKLQEGEASNMSDAADVSGGAFAQITEANDNGVYLMRVLTKNTKRYLRLYATVGTATCDFGALALLGETDKLEPLTQDNSIITVLGY